MKFGILSLFWAGIMCTFLSAQEITFTPNDSQTVIQNAINANPPYKKVVFSPGVYTKLNYITITPERVSLVTAYGAKFLFPPNQAKFTRMFNVLWGSINESPSLIWEGGEFDMNEPLQGRVSYNKEQQAGIFVWGQKAGTLNVTIKDVTIRNSAGDGINIYQNTNAKLDNLKFKDCFRSGLTISGGGNKITADKIDSEAGRFRTGLRIEPSSVNDRAIPAYYNISKFTGSYLNLQLGKDSAAIFSESVLSPINPFSTTEEMQGYVFNDQGRVVFDNCMFDLNRKFQIRLCGNTTFNDCSFRMSQYDEVDKFDYRFILECWWYWAGTKAGNDNQVLALDNCHFTMNDNVPISTAAYPIRTYSTNPYGVEDNYILLTNTKFDVKHWSGIVVLHKSALSSRTVVIKRNCLLGKEDYQ